MQLSLDIMLAAGAFVLLDTGAALVAPPCEVRWARPGSGSMAEVRDGSFRNLRDPMRRRVRSRKGKPASKAPGHRVGPQPDGAQARTRTSGRRAEPGSESISNRASDMGSRSALVVPMTPGNHALWDPAEGRGAPVWQNRRWETRRVL